MNTILLKVQKYLDSISKQPTKLNEKQPCRHLEDCPPRSYEPTIFNPFPGNGDDNLSGYSSAWSRRGFESSMKPSYERKYLYT